ncbi:MAG: NOB1 family endonuclease [Candidatus Diapherotrites archaeon]|nr:NOB1 family endonuclease [Candidatus Diapherotrites archaeon]
MYVLDASAFIHGKGILKGYTTPQVLSELKSVEAEAYWEGIKESVAVEEPLPYFVKRVRRFLREVGEWRLSEADVSVLALALQKKLPLVTDDYHLQNVALQMGVEVLDTGFGRVRRLLRYRWICPSCGRVFRKPVKSCPDCGVPLRRQSFSMSETEDTH